MIIKAEKKEKYTLLKLIGAIKLGESKDKFVQALKEQLDQKVKCLMIDFSEVNYIDSNGLGELVGYLDKFKEADAHLILLNPQSRIRELLKISRLDLIFPIYIDEQHAIEELQL